LIYELDDRKPQFKGDYFVAHNAAVIGTVRLGHNASVWWNVTIRGDNDWIELGDNVNIQDGSVVHTDEGVPVVLLHHLKHNKVLHEHVILMSITTQEVPEVPRDERVSVERLEQGFFRVTARYGFMETPDVPAILNLAREQGLRAKPMDTTFYLGRERIIISEGKKQPEPKPGVRRAPPTACGQIRYSSAATLPAPTTRASSWTSTWAWPGCTRRAPRRPWRSARSSRSTGPGWRTR